MIIFEAIGDFFGSITDWMNENLDGPGPIGAFAGVFFSSCCLFYLGLNPKRDVFGRLFFYYLFFQVILSASFFSRRIIILFYKVLLLSR